MNESVFVCVWCWALINAENNRGLFQHVKTVSETVKVVSAPYIWKIEMYVRLKCICLALIQRYLIILYIWMIGLCVLVCSLQEVKPDPSHREWIGHGGQSHSEMIHMTGTDLNPLKRNTQTHTCFSSWGCGKTVSKFVDHFIPTFNKKHYPKNYTSVSSYLFLTWNQTHTGRELHLSVEIPTKFTTILSIRSSFSVRIY